MLALSEGHGYLDWLYSKMEQAFALLFIALHGSKWCYAGRHAGNDNSGFLQHRWVLLAVHAH